MKKFKVAVLGCTGLVGQYFLKLLEEHPYFEITAISSSPRSAGKRYGDAVDWTVSSTIPPVLRDIVIAETSAKAILETKAQIAFSALPADIAREIETALAGEGVYVFSNASAHRLDSDVPILIPEVNPDHFELAEHQLKRRQGFIITNSNCSTAGLVLALKPLQMFGLNSVIVSTYQAVSGAGRRGVASLEIIGNVIPFINQEEDKIERETRKIFGILNDGKIQEAEMGVYASCCRVPTQNGHLESVVIELEEDVNEEMVAQSLSSFRGIPQRLCLPLAPDQPIILRKEVNRPQPLLDVNAGSPERAKGMAVSVGRIRKKGKKIGFFLLSHNCIRGAAGTTVLNAELAHAKGLLDWRTRREK